jgi:hypothetical protein
MAAHESLTSNSGNERRDKPAADAKVAGERREEPITKPGGFQNDPNDPTNPNEAIERHRRKVGP